MLFSSEPFPNILRDQIYEARLFRLSNVHGGIVVSPEEALESQKKKSALNQFYRSLAHSKTNSSSSTRDEEAVGKRDTGEKVVVSCVEIG